MRAKVSPAYAGWQDLAVHSGMSVRWLKAKVPTRLRIQPGGGKVLVRLAEFDEWFQGFRQGQDLDAVVEEILSGQGRREGA